MSHTPHTFQAFGVGKVLSDAFTVFRGAFLPIFTVLALASVIGTLLVFLIVDGTVGTVPFEEMGLIDVLLTLVSAILHNVALGAAILIAYNWGHGRPLSVANAISVALSKVHFLIILTFIWGLCVSIAMIFLLAPGLWLVGVWAAILPCIMIEGHGFGAFGRSAALTKDYRWPVVGALIVMVIIVAVLSGVLSAIAGAITGSSITGTLFSPATLIAILVQTLLGAAINGLFVAVMVSIYQRLIEIKEGGSNTGLADVFE